VAAAARRQFLQRQYGGQHEREHAGHQRLAAHHGQRSQLDRQQRAGHHHGAHEQRSRILVFLSPR